ncbi:MAG TPA: DegT/DnrJ/EryC1/StrS family aminotransferase [Nitriliruptorales bacterium]|nr:DegT/DnrJ/EryC1/StrS family aminotransferase [Nitriliruptorales bacterium]
MAAPLAILGGPPVRSSLLVFGSPLIGQPEIDEVVDSLRSGWIGTGPKVARFEEMFRDYVGARFAVAVNSCTAALHLSMLASQIGPGDEVITTPMTFAATANAIIHTGARPVFVDVDRGTQNISPDGIASAVTPRTRAIMPVHFAGYPCDMDAITSIASEHGLLVIEDAAHCVEGSFRDKKIGAIGDATCFSFYVTKNVTTIEGGMVTTNDRTLADRVKVSALHGLSRDAWRRFSDAGYRHYQVIAPGFKYNMTDVQASLGLHQLPRVGENHAHREQIWDRYDAAFADLPVDLPMRPSDGSVHALHLYTLHLRLNELSATRDEVLDALQAENIGCGVHYVGLHLHDYYQRAFGLSPDDFPESSYISERTLSIPFSAKLSQDDIDDVVAGVRKVLATYAR